jgi:putative hemolysin
MDGLWLPLLVVCSLIAVSGVFSGTEMALVTMSRPRLAAMAASGPRGAKIAALAAEPNRFLSAIQVGSVTAGFFSAAFGADRIGAFITPSLQKLGLSEYVANTVAVIGITLLITYLALVFAELAPRRLAMQRPERIALLFGPMVDRFARLMRPAIRLLSFSTNAVVRALGGDPLPAGSSSAWPSCATWWWLTTNSAPRRDGSSTTCSAPASVGWSRSSDPVRTSTSCRPR